MKKGFSLIELVIVIAIAGVLGAIVTNSFRSAQIQKEQETITQGLLASVEKQKADTQAGKGGSSYGVKFNADSYVLYTGTTYSAASISNRTVTVDPDFTLSNTISNSADTIYFSRLYGEASESATITISHVRNEVSPQLIVIEESGTISVIE